MQVISLNLLAPGCQKKHVTVVSQISADEYNVKMSMLHFGVHEWICLTYIKHILIKIVAILGLLDFMLSNL